MSTISIESNVLKNKFTSKNDAKNYEDYKTVYTNKKFQFYPLIYTINNE